MTDPEPTADQAAVTTPTDESGATSGTDVESTGEPGFTLETTYTVTTTTGYGYTYTQTTDDAGAVVDHLEGALGDLTLEEETVQQVLALLDDAGRQILDGMPQGLDGDIFGGSRKGDRMGRHTAGAHERVLVTLHMAMDAVYQHQNSLAGFRDQVARAEDETAARLAHLNASLSTPADVTTDPNGRSL